ncbi:hypothetical protein E1A91_D06G207400v1, partial [Gossypium mustelinum]
MQCVQANPKCLDELPTEIDHPTHRLYPLILNRSDSDYLCNLCQKQHSGPFYSCSLCHFNINVKCAWPRQGSFICDACGTEGNYTSCICLKCCIEVHKKCTSLPHIIKFSRHDHCIFHKHFLQTRELTRQDCKICFSEVKLDRGSYSCRKPGCNYVVYVNCVLEDYTLYEVIEDEKQFEELEEKSIQSSIIRVIEVNEAGEATKIQHFSHQHCLVLADKMEEEIDRKCEGMPLFLHKTCAELPRIKQHWFHQSNATLKYFDRYKWCNFRRRVCTGLFYDIRGYWNMCLRCAKVSDIIECKGHQHFLFFYFKCKEKCNGCGTNSISNGAFRCGNYCDFCKQYRDPSLWYYSCSICDTSAHIKCVLGRFPFIKDGGTFPFFFFIYKIIIMILKFLGRSRATLNALIV